MGSPRISYILVNWRTERSLPAALRSVFGQTIAPQEVILVNNASPSWDETLLASFPEVVLVNLRRNAGFAEGNNLGIRRATGEYIVLLNCDAELDSRFAENAVDAFARHPACGTVAPKLLTGSLASPTGKLDSTGHVMRNDRTAVSRGQGEQDQGQYDQPAWVFGSSAAAVAYRRQMLDSIVEGRQEYFDSSFFAYYEDVDLDWRAQLAGWNALYWPNCIAGHLAHGSGGRTKWHIRLRAEKNRYLMLAKNDTLEAQLPDLGALLVYELWHLLQLLRSPVQFLGFVLMLCHLPAALRKRWLRSTPKTDPACLAENFMPRGPIPPLAVAEPATALEQGLVSVVLVNYNGLELTAAALAGLVAQDYPSLEIILVDNASHYQEAERLAISYPHIRVLRMEQNVGFSAAVNWGVHLSRGEWVVLLNNDAVPDPQCISRLVDCQRRGGAWAVSGRLVDLSSTELVFPALVQVQDAESGQAAPDWTLPAELQTALIESEQNHGLSWYGYSVRNVYGRRNECFYPSGGLCCLPRSTLELLGPELFRHHFFAYYEDVELGFRIRAAGGWIAKEPSAAAVHLASSTTCRLGSFRLSYLRERNRLATLRVWLPGRAFVRLGPLMVLQCLLAFLWLLVARPLSAAGFAAAHLWCLGNSLSLHKLHRQTGTSWLPVPWPAWASQLSGQVRGSGGVVNRLALGWARLLSVPVLEDAIPQLQDAPVLAAAPGGLPAVTSGTPDPSSRAKSAS